MKSFNLHQAHIPTPKSRNKNDTANLSAEKYRYGPQEHKNMRQSGIKVLVTRPS